MSARNWLRLGLAGVAVAALAGPALATDDCCQEAPAPSAPAATKSLGAVSLTDQGGRAVTLPDGRVWVVTFFYGHCRDVCPALLYNLGAAADALPKDVRGKVGFAAVSFDPARDGVPQLAEYQRNFDLEGEQFHLMTGNPAALRSVFDAFDFSYKADRDGFQHVNLLAVMDGQGRIVKHFYGLQPDLARVASVVTALAGPTP